MPRRLFTALVPLLLSSAACLSVGPDANSISLNFDVIGSGAQGWEIGAADYPAGSEAAIALDGGDRIPPGAAVAALYQSGTNVSGDLFVFHRKYFLGLFPGATYTRASLQVAFTTNYHEGCTTGPGPAVVIKTGVSTVMPQADAVQGVYQLNLNKGSGTASGDYVQLGDIKNGLGGCPATGTYAVTSTADIRQSANLVADANGGFWVFLATQSDFNGKHEIYFTQLKLRLVPQ